MSALSLEEARDHLNANGTTITDDKLQGFIDAAEAYISKQVGPLVPTTITEHLVGAHGSLTLNTTPVISLTSITPVGGTAADLTYVDAGRLSGVLTWDVGGLPRHLRHSVVYVAGWDPLPADLLLAVKEMLRHLWSSQRGGTVRPGAQQDTTMAGYLVPNMVAALIEPYRVPGVA